MTYVYLMANKKSLNLEIIKKHVQYLKKLDDLGKLILCGPFTDYDGGIVILECKNIEEAKAEIFYRDWHLAKRQMTWFRRNKNIEWLELNQVPSYIYSRMASLSKI